MLGKTAVSELGLQQGTLEPCPFTINTSMGGLEKATGITIQPLLVRFQPHDVIDSAAIKVKAIATQAESYDVLVGAMVLYPMGFTIEFWNETVSYRPGWQAGDGPQTTLPIRFICKIKSHHVEYAMAGTTSGKVVNMDPSKSTSPSFSKYHGS